MGNIIIDKVSTAPSTRQKKVDTSAPMEIWLAANRIASRLQRNGQRQLEVWKGSKLERYAGGKVARMRIVEEIN